MQQSSKLLQVLSLSGAPWLLVNRTHIGLLRATAAGKICFSNSFWHATQFDHCIMQQIHCGLLCMCSVLNAEAWNVRQLEHQDAGKHADFLLLMAQGSPPTAIPPASANTADWTFQPYNQVANDYIGYQLMRPYQRIRQTHRPVCQPPCDTACPTCWYIQLLNSQQYSSADLTFELRLTCQIASAQQICPSPSLSTIPPYTPQRECSGNGTCTVFDPVCTDAAFQQGECTYCACKPGWGDVGCDVPVPDLQLEAVTNVRTSAGSWQYFNLALDVSHLLII